MKLAKVHTKGWNTSKVTRMEYMFCHCQSLTSLDVSNFDTSNVIRMISMFNDCRSLTNVNLKNVKLAYQLNYSPLLSKESLLYLINNSIATSADLYGFANTISSNNKFGNNRQFLSSQSHCFFCNFH